MRTKEDTVDINGFGSREEEIELRRQIYTNVVLDDDIRAWTWNFANGLRSPDDPKILPSDIEASKRYIEKVIMRANIIEVQGMTPKQFAATWANGALGAARYRARKALKAQKRPNADEE